MSKSGWTVSDMPDQTGRRVIVTGGNSGIGFYAALELARKGASVVLTARDAKKGEEAKARVLAVIPTAKIEVGSLDLASLDSVCAFAGKEMGTPLDILINNAGVMAPPKRQETDRGLELQFGTNVVGHFALTARLFPALTTSARGHMAGFDRPQERQVELRGSAVARELFSNGRVPAVEAG